MNNKVTVTGANILFFIFVALFIAFQLVLMVLATLFGGRFIERNTYGILIVNEYLLILVPVIVYALIKRFNFKEVFRFRKFSVLPGVIIVLLTAPAYAVALMLNTMVLYLLQFIGDIPHQPIPVPKTIGELVIGIIIVCISPAICEELLHRGILLRAYENRGTMKAVVISAIFFGFFHFDITNFFGPIFLGLLIGYYVVRTNSIFPGMLAHFLNNTFAEVLQYIGGEEPSSRKITIPLQDLVQSITYGVIGIVLVVILLKWFKKVTASSSVINPPISSVRKDITSIVSHWPVITVLALYVLMSGLSVLTMVLTKVNGLGY